MDSNEQKVTEAGMPKPNLDGRATTSAANGARGGRPRIRMDHWKWDRQRLNGASDKDIARALGISYRTLKRRKAERVRLDSPMG
jgi:hypothetical protein